MPGINLGPFSSTTHSIFSELPRFSEEKYWKLNILYSALENVLFSPNPNPKLTPEILHRLRTSFLDYKINIPSTSSNVITPEVKTILHTLVSREIKHLVDTLTRTNSIVGKSSPRKDETVFRIVRPEECLEELYNTICKRQKEIFDLDQEIEQLQHVRNEEAKKLENRLTEIKQDLEDLIRKASLHKEPEIVSRKLEYLKARSDFLATQTEIAKKEQFLAENPPHIVSQMQKYKELLTIVKNELREENSSKLTYLQKYETLTPDILAIISELKTTEDAISRQEWIKSELQGFNLSSSLPDNSLNEAFF